MEQAETKASLRLRVVFIIGAAVMLTLSGATLPRAITAIRDPRSNAFEVVPAFWPTITMFPLGLVTLIGGISGRGKHFKRTRTAFTIGVALLILVLLLEILRRMSQAMAG